jgi:acyl-CoA thioesterase II
MLHNLFQLQRLDDPNRFRWSPSPVLLTPATTLQGGAGLGAAITAMQTVSGRPVIWATAQYLAFAVGSEPVDLEVAIEVSGHNTTQARCVVSRDGKEILTAHAAFGSRDFDVEDAWCSPPVVPPPQDCPEYRFVANRSPSETQLTEGSDGRFVEFRLAKGRQMDDIAEQGGRGDGSFAVWVKRTDDARIENIGDLTYIGDFLPIGFAEAIGQPYVGNSLDNTIRVGKLVPTRWVLLSISVQQVSRGFGYGRAELWAEDGSLLAEVSQSAILRLHAKVHLPKHARHDA